MIKNYKNQTSLNAVLGFLIFFLSIGTAHADLSTNPYNPETDKTKIVENLGIPESSMELDRRCVYSKTEKWLANAPRNVFQTCVLVVTDDRLILVTYNEKEDSYNSPFSYLFSEIQEISVSEQDGVRLNVEGKKIQFQFLTKDGFFSVTAWRGKMGDRPIDSRGGQDAFDMVKAKGVAVTPSLGFVDMHMSNSFLIFRQYK